MADTHELTTPPATYQADEDWTDLSEDDQRWHVHRHSLIESGRATGGRIFLSNRQRAEYQIAPDDLLPESGPVRFADTDPDPAEREAERLATMDAPPTLAALTGRLDEAETRATTLSQRLQDARRAHREEIARITALELTAGAASEMTARADESLTNAEAAIQTDGEALAAQAASVRADLGTLSPPARISTQLATDASAYVPHVTAEAALMDTASLAARLRGVIAQDATHAAVLAWLTAARQRLATLEPDDTARYDLQAALTPLAERFTDSSFAASQATALGRIEAGISKVQSGIRRGQQERGIHPAWLGDLTSSRVAR